ncbi:septum site-determining protein MinC [Ramlibacter ginsenosidimutans]|uniref:Probable septum site-determining protein MinC n=1 Tax=Ramlibacter ginsenosidimutans TaxID=502333 RepID=A0A934WLM9_9BURK|nr:septum site-determining protein MinC [Ramlibacter ginsenosidimutans]MBK6005583.1 septum site-determining protein MinC [Ramlibacter ginsenosidimutans]
MTVAIAGRAPATFEIKSANLPLVALLLKSCDLDALSRELQDRFGDSPDFFDHDPLVIDLAPLGGAAVDFKALLKLLKAYRVLPVAVKGGNEEQMRSALQLGLAAAPEAALTPAPSRREREEQPEPAPAVAQQAPRAEPVQAAAAATPPASALVIDKPLRSGQQVYARGRDLVVLSMVNAGAEVIADGHIHVYAPLRGKAIAGARGDAQARILTLCLEPELVSIAGTYRTSEIPLPEALRGKAAQVRLVDDKLVMEPLNP